MIDILAYLPGRRKQTPSGWISFNAPCCTHNGQNADHRGRGGLKLSEQGWTYHCFNCQYTASFIQGRNLSFKARRLMSWLGVSDAEIEHANLESMRHRSIHGILDDRQRDKNLQQDIHFEERELPPAAEFVDRGSETWQYLMDRCVPADYPFMAENTAGVGRPSVVVPFTYNNTVVGWTRRFLDDRNPRYISDAQPGYVFGTDLQQDSWQHVIVVEGIFDALSIGGLALMHNTVSEPQARLIRSLGREITVVPDQDRAGLELIDRAVELGWAVSIPDWEDCKDVNDAVKKYGRLATLITIMQARETSRIKIELRKRNLAKQLH